MTTKSQDRWAQMQGNGKRGETAVSNLLIKSGRNVQVSGYRDHIDFIVDGLRVELKTSVRRKIKDHEGWTFNIHRHGAMPTVRPDLYILRLENVPFCKYNIHFVLDGNYNSKTIEISVRSLLNQEWHEGREMFKQLKAGTLEAYAKSRKEKK